MKKVWLVIWIIVVGGGLAVGGYFAWQKISRQPFLKTHEGISFEEILPKDTAFVLNFFPTDPAERERFKNLWNTVLQDKKDALPLLVAQNFISASNEDFLRILDSSYAFTFAITGNIGQKPTFYFLLAVDDNNKDALFEIVKQLQANKPALRADLIGDVIRITNAKENSTVSPKSLADSAVFKKSSRELQAPFSGYIFMSSQFLGQFSPGSNVASFHAKKDGLLISSAAIFDKKSAVLKPYAALLYQFIPGASDSRKPIFYTEGGGLGEISAENFYYGFKAAARFDKLPLNYKDFLENFKKSTGFDFETDIKPVFDNGFAMALHDTGFLLPAFSLFIDAKSAPEKALNLVKALQERDTAWIILGNLGLQSAAGAPADSPVIEPRRPFKSTPNAGTIKIYLDRIPKQIAAIPLFEKFTEPLEISYGMTAANLLFFSTLPNLEEALESGASIAKSTDIFQQAAESLGIEPGSIAHFDFSALGSYAERLLAFAKEEEKLSPDQEGVYLFLKKYLAPLKTFIQVSQGDGKMLRGKSFLKISAPKVP